jgi:lipid-A-disaccharide synthase-like uncharacterized protein
MEYVYTLLPVQYVTGFTSLFYFTLLPIFIPAYLGVVGNKESESVLSTYWAARALGATVMFFLSITDSDSVQIPLGVLLTTFVIGYVLYLAAECVFGERLSFCKFNSMCPPKNGAISVSNSLAVSDNINMTIQPVSDYEVT